MSTMAWDDTVEKIFTLIAKVPDVPARTAALTAHADCVRTVDPVTAAVCLGLIFIMESPKWVADIPNFALNRGNMLLVLQDRPEELPAFLSRFPSTAAAFVGWSWTLAPAEAPAHSGVHCSAQFLPRPPAQSALSSGILKPHPAACDQLQTQRNTAHGVNADLGRPARRRETLCPMDYADLRTAYPPRSMDACEGAFAIRLRQPLTSPDHPVMKFVVLAGTPPRTRRWLFWRRLAEMEAYVYEFYAFSDHESSIKESNKEWSSAKCHDGAESVQTPWGTINWYASDNRIHAPNGGREMDQRLHAIFEP